MALSSKSSVPELFHPQGTFKFSKGKFGSTERSTERSFRLNFRATWCEDYLWLHYDKASDSAFRHLCMRAVSEVKLLASTKCDPTFISSGYTNWKEATTGWMLHIGWFLHTGWIYSNYNIITVIVVFHI